MSSTTAPAAARPNLDIGLVFKQSWHLFVKDIGPLLIAWLIATVLGVVTLGILIGPLYAGLFEMVNSRIRDGRQPQVGDVFNGLSHFWRYFGAALALLVLIGLAWLTIIGGVLLATIWLYVFPLMIDRGMGLGEAMRTSKDMVLRAGFWQHLALVLLWVIVSVALDALVGFALSPILAPFGVVTVGVAYYLAGDRAGQVEQAAATPSAG